MKITDLTPNLSACIDSSFGDFGEVLGRKIDLLPMLIENLYLHDYNNAVTKLTQYITWLQTYEEPKIVEEVENNAIFYIFEDILNMVKIEYKNEDVFHKKYINIIRYTRDWILPSIDIDYFNRLSFIQKQKKISKIINKVYYWLLEPDNIIRERMILFNLHKEELELN